MGDENIRALQEDYCLQSITPKVVFFRGDLECGMNLGLGMRMPRGGMRISAEDIKMHCREFTQIPFCPLFV